MIWLCQCPTTNSSKLSKGWQVLLLLSLRPTKSYCHHCKGRVHQYKCGTACVYPCNFCHSNSACCN
uniref:Cl716_1 n=1 Tax=Arundo donax TaxID=35708 RepID=A0A0A9R8K3_ARUDO